MKLATTNGDHGLLRKCAASSMFIVTMLQFGCAGLPPATPIYDDIITIDASDGIDAEELAKYQWIPGDQRVYRRKVIVTADPRYLDSDLGEIRILADNRVRVFQQDIEFQLRGPHIRKSVVLNNIHISNENIDAVILSVKSSFWRM